MKLYIRAQARSQSDVLAKLEENTKKCMEHLAKLWIFPNSNSIKHWKHEVWSYYDGVTRVKPRNRLVSAKKILDNTWNLHSHQVKSMVERAIENESNLIPDELRLQQLDILQDKMEDYFIWIANTLSKQDDIPPSMAYDKLNELGF